jgi:quinone-modifying oxidoreductase subunit QmoC
VVFSKFIPILYVETIFVAAMALAVAAAVGGGVRYWGAMRGQAPGGREGPWPVLAPTLGAILRHRKFAECRARPAGARATHKEHLGPAHRWVFYGFLGLVATTTSVGIGIYAFGYLTPWPLWHPVKILGNASGLAVIGAVLVFAYRRLADGARAGKSTYGDWLFLGVLLLTTLTGFLCELLRLAQTPRLAYPTYVVHLVLVFVLLVYIPYSKFAHLAYRTTALVFAATTPASGRPG